MRTISAEVQKNHNNIQTLSSASGDADSPLKSVAESCQENSLRISVILEKCRSRRERSVGDSVKATLRHIFAKNELENLQKELESSHSRLQTALALSTR